MLSILKGTNYWKNYWQNRKLDWATAYTNTHNHPHRYLISAVLKTFYWLSLFEIGCGSGANLINIVKHFPKHQLGGIDINPEAIRAAEQNFKGAIFQVGSGEDIFMSDDFTDVVLCDALLIYVGPLKIKKYLREIKRITRNYIVLCEFHSKNWFQRMRLKVTSGYNAYNYKTLLESCGFYDIMLYKIPKEAWPGTPWQEFGYIITAKVPRHK